MKNEENSWTILSSEKIYENAWIGLTEHKVLNPAGGPGIYGVIHFQNLAIGVLPYADGKLWLVGQYRFPLEAYSWEIPEGGGALDVDPLASAARELQEETGLRAEKYEVLLEMDVSNSVTDERAIVYLATGLQEGEASPEDTEDLQLRTVTLAEAYAMVERQEIRDSLTVAAIFKLKILDLEGKLDV
ncbi:MAG TPA: NUDIX hydrolase [Bacteroidetes bacterium]|nr:NUDIX hydrolase [Bacteroidota bacterium]